MTLNVKNDEFKFSRKKWIFDFNKHYLWARPNNCETLQNNLCCQSCNYDTSNQTISFDDIYSSRWPAVRDNNTCRSRKLTIHCRMFKIRLKIFFVKEKNDTVSGKISISSFWCTVNNRMLRYFLSKKKDLQHWASLTPSNMATTACNYSSKHKNYDSSNDPKYIS